MPTTTTWGAIRDQLVTTIAALTPARESSIKYTWAPRAAVEYYDAADFRSWAEDTEDVCFRYYDLTTAQAEPDGPSDGADILMRATLELVIAYPHQYATYGADNAGEMRDFMEQDVQQIAANIGRHGSANWVAGARPNGEQMISFETGNGASFAVLSVGYRYYYNGAP